MKKQKQPKPRPFARIENGDIIIGHNEKPMVAANVCCFGSPQSFVAKMNDAFEAVHAERCAACPARKVRAKAKKT